MLNVLVVIIVLARKAVGFSKISQNFIFAMHYGDIKYQIKFNILKIFLFGYCIISD